MLVEGNTAPAFDLATDDGGRARLSEFKGAPVVIYFYPKDDTSGCTAEAQDFTRLSADFEKAGARLIGISPDGIASHQKFRKKYELQVTLAADEDKAVANAYGVWVEKSMYGRKYMGIERSTFLIDGGGKIARIWRKVKVKGHAAEVLSTVQELRS
jgi:thioredoxin-dependent peroxiredoxin